MTVFNNLYLLIQYNNTVYYLFIFYHNIYGDNRNVLLPSIHEACVLVSITSKNIVVHVYNPTTREGERGSEVQGQPLPSCDTEATRDLESFFFLITLFIF